MYFNNLNLSEAPKQLYDQSTDETKLCYIKFSVVLQLGSEKLCFKLCFYSILAENLGILPDRFISVLNRELLVGVCP